jgi:hypothetical protein
MLCFKVIQYLFLLQFSQNYDAKVFNILARPGEFWRGSFLSWAWCFLLYLPKEFNSNPMNAAIVHCAALLIDCGRLMYSVKTAEKARSVIYIAKLLKFHSGLLCPHLWQNFIEVLCFSWLIAMHSNLLHFIFLSLSLSFLSIYQAS